MPAIGNTTTEQGGCDAMLVTPATVYDTQKHVFIETSKWSVA